MNSSTTNNSQFKAGDKIIDDFTSSPSRISTRKDFLVRDSLLVSISEISQKKGQRFNRTAFFGANYTAATSDYLIGITKLVVAPSIGLPLPSLVGTGKTFKVKDEVGGAATTTITIQSDGEKTIDGASNATITTNYGTKHFYTDGSNWFTC